MDTQQFNTSDSTLYYSKQYNIVIRHFGPTTSAVFSEICNYSKLSGGCCQLSETSLGDLLNISWSNIKRSIDELKVVNLIIEVPHDEDSSKLDQTKWYKPDFSVVSELINKEALSG